MASTSKAASELNCFQCVDCIIKMDTATLRRFIKEELRQLQICCRCKKPLKDIERGFFCPSHHLVCESCTYNKCPKCESFVQWDCRSKCPKCESFVEWNRRSKWRDISLKCEWGCNADIKISEYMQHLQLCEARKYKCPGTNCQYISCLDDLKNHWHLSPLRYGDVVKIAWEDEAFYWLLPVKNEIVYVTSEMSRDYCLFTVYENDAVLPTSYRFKARDSYAEMWTSLENGIGRFVKMFRYIHDTTLSVQLLTDS